MSISVIASVRSSPTSGSNVSDTNLDLLSQSAEGSVLEGG